MKSRSYGLIPSLPLHPMKRSSSTFRGCLRNHPKSHLSHRSLQLEPTSNFKVANLLQQLPSQLPNYPVKLLKTSLPCRFFRRSATSRKLLSSSRTLSHHPIISLPSAPLPKLHLKSSAAPAPSYTDSLLRLHMIQPHRRAVELNVLHRLRQSQKRRLL